MVTAYSLLLDRCGLSHREAAALHGVRLDTVKSWASGRNQVAAGVVDELRALFASIERAAAAAIDGMRGLIERPDVVELGLATSDNEAVSLGWPCVGAQAAMLGLVAARTDLPCRIVPRASTPATAEAAKVLRAL